MHLFPLGDCAVLVRIEAKTEALALEEVTRLARRLMKTPLSGVMDVVPSFETVAVHYDPAKIGPARADAKTGETAAPFERVSAWIRETIKGPAGAAKAGREVVLPVCYGGEEGPDLGEVAAKAKISEAEVVRVHSKATYRVAAVGFSPGFPYLAGLAPRLAMPRRATPRVSVPAGSVGIGGVHTGVYPTSSPGGWSIIGRTPLRLFRPEDEGAPTLLEAGDTVRFKPVSAREAQKLLERPVALPAPKVSRQAAVLEVLKPGAFTTVQDLGRAGMQHHGISAGGAMDRRAARVANLLLGNDENAPLLEATLTGPEVKFVRDTWIAVTGAEVRDVPGRRPLRVTAGQVVSFAAIVKGARAYVAVSGGLEIARVLGGAGTLVRAGIGGWRGRALQAGDVLGAVARDVEIAGGWSASPEFHESATEEIVARVIRGPQWDWFSAVARAAFLSTTYEITPKSDRMGLRLSGERLVLDKEVELTSEGVGFGSVQVPRDGQPIVLMADRQTIGGYPKIADVISIDLPKLAQARSGVRVRFKEVSLAEAHRLYLQQEHALAVLAAGVRGKLKENPR